MIMKYSLKDVKRFWSKVAPDFMGCWEWQGGYDGHNYGKFWAQGHKNLRANRVAYEIVYGPIPNGLEVCHTCDNPRCVRPDHLFIATHAGNMSDASRKGRMPGSVSSPVRAGENHWMRRYPERIPRGSRRGHAKISEADVLQIRKLSETTPQHEIAILFGIAQSTVSRLLKGFTWNHVK
jgi:hypothetical protein